MKSAIILQSDRILGVICSQWLLVITDMPLLNGPSEGGDGAIDHTHCYSHSCSHILVHPVQLIGGFGAYSSSWNMELQIHEPGMWNF